MRINPKNIVPVYDSLEDQQFRQRTAAGEPFTGLLAGSKKLLPIQFRLDTATTISVFQVLGLDGTGNSYATPTDFWEIHDMTTGEKFVQWKEAAALTSELPVGGFYYVRLVIDGAEYFTEVFEIKIDDA